MLTTLKRIVTWSAVSTEEQAKHASPEKQRADNYKFVNETLPLTYGAKGEIIAELELADSRSIIELSEAAATYPDSYGVLYDMLRQKERAFDLLVCRSADRLGRTRSLISTIEELCAARGIIIICVAESLPVSLDPTRREGDSYRLASRGAASYEEIVRMRIRRDDGMRDTRLREKKLFPAKPNFGYAYRDKGREEIVIDEEAAVTVRRLLVELYAVGGEGTYEIAKVLNAQGRAAPKGGTWTPGSVGAIIDRAKVYAGWLEFNRDAQANKEYVLVRGNYPPIITDAELALIEAERADRTKRPIRRRDILSGVAVCQSCGQPLTYHTFTRDGEHVSALRCARAYCPKPVAIRAVLVLDAIHEFITGLGALSDPAQIIEGTLEDPTHLLTQLARLDKRLADQTGARKRTLRAFTELGAMTEAEFVDALRALERQAETTQKEREEVQARLAKRGETDQRIARLEELRDLGPTMLADIDAKPQQVNAWLRKRLRAWVRPGSRYEERVYLIELL